MRYYLLLAAIALACMTPLHLSAQTTAAEHAATAHWRVRLAALTPQGHIRTIPSAQVASWTPTGHITLQTPKKIMPLVTPELLSLRRNNTGKLEKRSARDSWWLHLRTGDILAGTPLGSHGGTLAFRSLIFGKISVPLDDVAGLSRKRKTPMLAGITHDHAQFINGDKLSGAMLRFLPQAVQWHSTLGTITIPLARMEDINLAETLAPPAYHGPLIRLSCIGGTVVTATAVAWRRHTLVLTPLALPPISCGVNVITRIDIIGGNITWLTNVVPQQYIQTPYVGTPWPLQKNLNCAGHPLCANGRIFRHGLGTHVAASLTYNLEDQYTILTFIPAMDQSSRPWGACSITVQADGKPLYTSRLLKAGEVIQPVTLPVKHVKMLTFFINGINVFGVRGRVDLLDAALLK